MDEALTLYALRHSCASLLLAAGVHPKVVSEMLGGPVESLVQAFGLSIGLWQSTL